MLDSKVTRFSFDYTTFAMTGKVWSANWLTTLIEWSWPNRLMPYKIIDAVQQYCCFLFVFTAASQAGDADSSRAPGLTSVCRGP